MWSVMNRLEVTLFRQDLQLDWNSLKEMIVARFNREHIVVLHGKPKGNRWIHISCIQCGAFVYVAYGKPDSDDNRKRSKLFHFFMQPSNFGLLREV